MRRHRLNTASTLADLPREGTSILDFNKFIFFCHLYDAITENTSKRAS